MHIIKISDEKIIIYLGLGLPIFLIIIMSILLLGAVMDRLSFGEAFEGLKNIVPLFLTYVGAIVGFSFSSENRWSDFSNPSKSTTDVRKIIRTIISLLLPFTLMVFLFVVNILLILDVIKFEEYKQTTAFIIWTLSGVVSFIIGKYFGYDSIPSKITENKEIL